MPIKELTKEEIIRRAGLDRTPESILEEQKGIRNPSWFERRKRNILHIGEKVENAGSTSAIVVLTLAALMILLASMLIAIFSLIQVAKHGISVIEKKHLFIAGLLASIQFSNVCWFVYRSSIGKRFKLDLAFAALSPTDAVMQRYAEGLKQIQFEFLGENSEIKKTQQELNQRVALVRTQRERVSLRLRPDANVSHSSVFRELDNQLQGREERLTEMLNKVNGIIAKTEAFFAECETNIQTLHGPVDDVALILEIQSGAAHDEDVIRNANRVLHEHVDRLGETLMQLHEAFASTALPPTVEDKDMDVYFQRIDEAAVKVAALEGSLEEPDEAPETVESPRRLDS